jgi:hypothetical protein
MLPLSIYPSVSAVVLFHLKIFVQHFYVDLGWPKERQKKITCESLLASDTCKSLSPFAAFILHILYSLSFLLLSIGYMKGKKKT